MISLIDDGKNPDEFTRDVLNSCIAKNQSTKGKTDAFKVVLTAPCGRLLKIYLLSYLYLCFHKFTKIFIECCPTYYIQGLRKHLLEELEQTFPDEVESYREIRAASAAVS